MMHRFNAVQGFSREVFIMTEIDLDYKMILPIYGLTLRPAFVSQNPPKSVLWHNSGLHAYFRRPLHGMNTLLTTALGRYRLLGFIEGLSLLILMGVAMPIKYVWDNPFWVQKIGMVHGILFVLYAIETFRIASERQWSFRMITLPLLIGSILPFGTFVADHRLLRHLK
jgi:integral membrane protein